MQTTQPIPNFLNKREVTNKLHLFQLVGLSPDRGISLFQLELHQTSIISEPISQAVLNMVSGTIKVWATRGNY